MLNRYHKKKYDGVRRVSIKPAVAAPPRVVVVVIEVAREFGDGRTE